MADVGRRRQRQRHRQEHGVDGRLERAEQQRHQAHLRLVILAAGGLPHVVRLVVAFVVDLAEERLPTDFRMRAADAPGRQAARRRPGPTRRRRGATARPAPAAAALGVSSPMRRQVALAGHVVHRGGAISVEAQQGLVSLRGHDLAHRGRMGLQRMNQAGASATARRRCERRTRWSVRPGRRRRPRKHRPAAGPAR